MAGLSVPDTKAATATAIPHPIVMTIQPELLLLVWEEPHLQQHHFLEELGLKFLGILQIIHSSFFLSPLKRRRG